MKCIQRNNDDYRDILEIAQGNRLLADNAIYTYWAENEYADKAGSYPPGSWVESFIRGTIDDLNNIQGKVTTTVDEAARKLDDFYDQNTKGEPDDESIGPDRPIETEIKYSTQEAVGIAYAVRNALSFTPHRGESKMPTGITSLFDKEVYDPRDGAIVHKETINTHSGSLIHKLLETRLSDVPIVWSKMDEKYNLVSVENKEHIESKIDRWTNKLKKNFDIIATELPIKVSVDGQEKHGFVDLVVRNKWDGRIGIIDYKTSAEEDYVGNSKFLHMADDVSKERGTKWDKLQEQTLAYQLTMNNSWKEQSNSETRFVDYRAFMPISVDMDKSGKIKDINLPTIGDLQTVVDNVYMLKNTAYHMESVKNALGLSLDFDPDRPLAFENQVREIQGLLGRINNEWRQMHLHQRANDIQPLISGLNILSEPEKTLTGLDKYIDSSLNSSSPDNLSTLDRPDIIHKISSDVDLLTRPIAALSAIDRDAIMSLLKNVHEIPQERLREEYKALEDIIWSMRSKFDKLNNNLEIARAGIVRRELDSPQQTTNLYMQFARDKFYKEKMAQKRAKLPEGKDIRLYDHEEELKREFAELIQDPQNKYASSINRIKDAIVGIGSASDIAMDQARTLLANLSASNIPFFSQLAPAKNVAHPVGRIIINKLDKARKGAIDSITKEKDFLEGLSKGIYKASKTHNPRKAYDFMLEERKDKEGNITVHNVTEIDWDRWEAYKEENLYKTVRDLPKQDKWGRPNPEIAMAIHHFERNTMKVKEPVNLLRDNPDLIDWDVAMNPLHGRNQWERIRSGAHVNDRDKEFAAARYTAKSLDKFIDELVSQKKITPSQEKEARYHVQNMKDLRELVPERESDDVTQIYNYLNDAISQIKGEVYLPPEEFISDKYRKIMSMDPKDPRRMFYEHYMSVKQQYDMIVPSVKKLGDNLPAVYKTSREEGLQLPFRRDKLADDYRKNVGDKGGWLIGKHMFSKPWVDKWLGGKNEWEVMHRAWEYGSSIPLPYSGYNIDPNNRSYDMAFALFKLATSYENYKSLSPIIPEVELLYDTWKKSAPTAIKKNKLQETVGSDEMGKVRKIIDLVTYGKDKGGSLANILSNYMSYVSFMRLGYKSMLAMRSHILSAVSLRSLAYYPRSGEFSQRSLLRTNIQHVIDSVPHLYEAISGNKVTKSSKVMDYFGLKRGDKVLYEGVGGSDKSPNPIKNALSFYTDHAYDLLQMSDNVHLGTVMQTYAREKHVFDKEGKDLGSLWSNMNKQEDGTYAPNDAIRYLNPERTVEYSKEAVQRMVEEVIGATTSVKNPLDRPIASLSLFGRLHTMIKTIGLNGMSEWLAHPHFDEKTGDIAMGPYRQLVGPKGVTTAKAVVQRLTGYHQLSEWLDGKADESDMKRKRGWRLAENDLTQAEVGRVKSLTFAARYVLAWTTIQMLMSAMETKEEKKERLDPDNWKQYWLKNVGMLLGDAVEAQLSPTGFAKLAMDAYTFAISTGPISDGIKFTTQALKDAYLMTQGLDPEKYNTGYRKDSYKTIELGKKLIPYYGNDKALLHPEQTLRYQDLHK